MRSTVDTTRISSSPIKVSTFPIFPSVIKYVQIQHMQADLVGGFNPSEKILVNWDDYSQYMGK